MNECLHCSSAWLRGLAPLRIGSMMARLIYKPLRRKMQGASGPGCVGRRVAQVVWGAEERRGTQGVRRDQGGIGKLWRARMKDEQR